MQHLVTNVSSFDASVNTYTAPLTTKRGDELARFELGSTVVLVFEAPGDFGFGVAPGARVRVGQPLGACGRAWCASADEARERRRRELDAQQQTRRSAAGGEGDGATTMATE